MNSTAKLPGDNASEEEERAFWEENDSSEVIDWGQAESVTLPNLKPSTRTISLRLPEGLLDRIKVEAHRRDIPYQSLIKAWLAEAAEHSGEHGGR